MQIKILDGIECQVIKKDGVQLVPCLSFEAVYWKQGPHKKTKHAYQKHVFSFKGKTHWCFYTGLLPRVTKWCEDQGIPVEIVGEEIIIKPQNEPHLDGITFRPDQLMLMNAACKAQRGVISSTTGSGKTLMQLGILSCYPKCRALILAHSTEIVSQTFKKLQEFGFKSIETFGGGIQIQKPSKQIVVATMQSFVKLDTEDYIDYFDIVLLDESHHLQSMKSKNKDGKQTNTTYVEILSHLLAPIRIGWTATTRSTDEAVLINEGLLGPLIKKVTIQEAADLGILATPKLKLIKAKCSQNILDLRKYQDVYSYGIVNNQLRNKQVAEIVEEFYNQGKTTLIFVVHLEHGDLIKQEIKKLIGIKVPFIQGNMPQKERTVIKTKLISKKIKVCLATVSWSEGVDVPSLDVVITAGGGKSEIQTLQRLGRGLRKTDKKDEVIIVDFLDLSHMHLIRQTGERLATYSEHNFL